MARTPTAQPSREILEAALQGLESQRKKLEEQIGEVKGLLGRRPGRPPKSTGTSASSASAAETKPASTRKRILSPEARKRIAAAQKKRWAAYRKSS